MYKITIIILISVVICFSSDVIIIVPPTTKYILLRNNIDLDTKSIKGWLRIFNSNDKINKYNFIVTEQERQLILFFLKTKLKNKTIKYKRGIK